jgi:hypothetical protein
MPPIGEVLHVYPKPQGPNVMWLGGQGLRGVMAQVFHYRNKHTHTQVCFIAVLRGKIKKKAEERWGGWPEVTGIAAVPNSVLRTGAGGQHLLQALQDVDHQQDFLR